MFCIGNDVVDWKDPASAKKSRDSRYLKKILTSAEIEFVRNAENPDIMLWSLWACKETAYKVVGKSSAGRPFLPRCWSVKLSKPDSMFREGEVILPEGNTVFIRLYCAESYLHCIGSDCLSDLDKIIWGIDTVPETVSAEDIEPSLFMRQCLFRRLAVMYQLDSREMEIRRAKNNHELQPPYLYYKNRKAPFDISLSHDGQFVAYAFICL